MLPHRNKKSQMCTSKWVDVKIDFLRSTDNKYTMLFFVRYCVHKCDKNILQPRSFQSKEIEKKFI